MAGKAIYAGLMQVQQTLKAPKDKNGGKYKYRSAEDILENVKPLLKDAGLILKMKEEIKADAIGSYIESVVTVIDIATGDREETSSQVREDVGTKFMSPGQATGAAISYARKYALCGMFAIDNEEDLDSPSYQQARKAPKKDESDIVMAKAVERLNGVIKGKGLSKNYLVSTAEKVIGKKSVADMTTEEVLKLAEVLEYEE